MEGVWENFMRNNQDTFKSLFQRKKSSNDEDSLASAPTPIPQLSSLANSVVFRCSKILKIPTEELQHRFDIELPESVKQLFTYARNFLEFCSYQALHNVTRNPDYLSDTDFRRLTYDMMLAWEAPCVEFERGTKETSPNNDEVEDDEDGALFYSSPISMAVQVDDKKTVGREAFGRIAPACAVVADIITVHNLFDALTSSAGPRLHFIIYDKYLRSLDKVINAAKNTLAPSLTNLPLSDVEIIIDIEGGVPTQPVLQHVGISAWPGRLTLTNFALYFEALGVGVYDKAVRYDLATDLKQVIKPELTGPLGARLFDKAVMYKSTTVTEPVYFEFPEFKGNFRRNFWLDISLEILHAHRFARKHNFKETQQSEVVARAILGIFRYRALREAFQFFSSQYKTLLSFNLAESIPGGDAILETLANRMAHLNVDNSPGTVKHPPTSSPFSLLALSQLGFIPQKNAILDGETLMVGDFCVGETHPLEIAVKKTISDTGRAEAAQATVNQVKVEGIETNLAVMKELMLPFIQLATCLVLLFSWKEPFKSTVFLMLTSFAIIR
ncbi:G patch domain-containing protein 11-like [Hibiscus syriacus]|uniref:G patch domain-containing protein 11-like n=2 Tax=Hibiscus syriacus TaxID=106335 RepID=A0A6A2ZLC7_HIBSY|nr:G patch domain-containing protein 11-like [Hibiscus syriacus]